MRACVCIRACVRACVRACMCACVCACVRVCQVSRGSESFRMEKLSEKAIQHVSSRYYLRGLCSQIHTPIYASPNPGETSKTASRKPTHYCSIHADNRCPRWTLSQWGFTALCLLCSQRKLPSTTTSQMVFSEECQWCSTSLGPTASSAAARVRRRCPCK